MKKLLIIIFIFLITFLTYTYKLSEVPVHLNQDELGYSINAYSIAKTGYDENGKFLPLYFWHLGVVWATPIIVYLTAIFLIFFPLSEEIIRLPSVMVGIIDVILIYLVAERWFRNPNLGLLAAVLLLFTPVHFIQSRILLDNLYPVPFVLLWLLFLQRFLEEKKIWLAFTTTLSLGLGIHTYHAPKFIMPIYFLATFILIFPRIKNKLKLSLILVLGFLLPLIPLFIWQSSNDTLQDLLYYVGLHNSNLSPVQGVLRLLSFESLSQKLIAYRSFFDPWFLFNRGDASLAHSTGQVGVFLLPFIIFLPLGFYQILRKDNSRMNLLLLFGFLTAPIAASVVGQPYRISRALVILPFAIIIAIYGIKFLMNKWVLNRVIIVILLGFLLIQYAYFTIDYFNNYSKRSYVWFNYNIPDAYERLINISNEELPGAIYIDNKIPFADRYWRFYLIKYQKENLFKKTIFFNAANLNDVSSNSLILYRFDSLSNRAARFIYREEIKEPDNFTSFYIYHD